MMLTQFDVQVLEQSYALLERGDVAAAQARLGALPDAKLQHPDVVHLLALIMIRLGETGEARDFLEYATRTAPKSYGIWASYANLLGDLGEIYAAKSATQKAAALDPKAVDPWLNFGISAMDAGEFDEAAVALERASGIAPASTAVWTARGLLEQRRGAPDAAVGHYQQALAHDPRDARSRHNLGVSLRAIDQREAALEQIELAIALGSMVPESFTMRAHLLADLGRFDDAVGQYREIVKAVPEHLDAHETLALLLPQVGAHTAALDSYRAALDDVRASPELWRSALGAAKAVGDYDQLLAWAVEAETTLGADPGFVLARATGLMHSGNPLAALTALEQLVNQLPDDPAAHSHLAYVLLMLGDPAKAEAHAVRATQLAPLDQSGWAYLTVIWRLHNDPREAWLADYDRLVMPIDIVSADEAMALATIVDTLHLTAEHPAEQSLRGGTQTRGNIFDRRNPDMRGFAAHVRGAVEGWLAQLPRDDSHPFLARNSGVISFAGSWSVRLRSAGYHTNHIHQEGWLSSAFYVSLPSEVGASGAGALTFGVPDAALGIDLAPRRIAVPRAGRLVLFPSYFWHGTLPFESAQPRTTMAFDAVPVFTA